jgi:hypothetical protein
MKQYILRERLADFLEKAWDAGVRVELNPTNGYVIVYSPSYHSEYLDVLDGNSYDDMVSNVIAAAKGSDDTKCED